MYETNIYYEIISLHCTGPPHDQVWTWVQAVAGKTVVQEFVPATVAASGCQSTVKMKGTVLPVDKVGLCNYFFVYQIMST